MYNFTELAVQLNEPEQGVAPTDTRLRPDQRLMEDGKWDEANKEKLRLEEKQRITRKQREMKNMAAIENDLTNSNIIQNTLQQKTGESENDDNDKLIIQNSNNEHEPIWFKKVIDQYTNQPIHLFKNEYWDCKMRNDWKRCPDIF
jgi:hypothetical protein